MDDKTQAEIRKLLHTYHTNTLWDIARATQLPGATGSKLRKAKLMSLLQKELFRPERIKNSYQDLSKLEKEVLDRLLLHGAATTTRLFRRELVRAGLVKKPDSSSRRREVYGRRLAHEATPNDSKSTVFVDVIARLTQKGLVFSRGTPETTGGNPYKLQFHPGDTLFVPDFVREHLPQPEPLPEQEQWQPPHVQGGDPQRLLRDLYLYWDAVRREPANIIKSGYVGKRGLKRLNEMLLAPDPALDEARREDQAWYLYLLRQVLTGLDLAQTYRGELEAVTADDAPVPDFWRETTAVQVRRVLDVWTSATQPFRLEDNAAGDFTPAYRRACQLLVEVLPELSPERWLEAEDLQMRLQVKDRDFLFGARRQIISARRYSYGSYYYGGRYQDPGKALQEMDALELKFVHGVVRQILFRLGLVELGYAEADASGEAWQVFRFTDLGRAVFFRDGAEEKMADAGQVIVQPNFQILAMGPVPLHILAHLDIFAERQKVDRTAFEYHLSRESVYAAQQRDFSVEQVEEFLNRVTPIELPQNIRRSLAEWGAHHERITFRRGVTLLQAADAALLEDLMADEKMGEMVTRSVGTAVALVKSGREEALIAALQNRGELPAVTGADPASADKSVIVSDDGRIQPVHAVPSLHLSGRLARFSEETEGGWRISEKSARRAGGSKRKVEKLLAELERLHRGTLPSPLADKIKAWGNYYGDATLGEYILLEFRDQEALAELRQHPKLSRMLYPFPAGDRALASVAPEDVDSVQNVLADLGVRITQSG